MKVYGLSVSRYKILLVLLVVLRSSESGFVLGGYGGTRWLEFLMS